MFCCANCFDDSVLNNHIPKISTQTRTCHFCGAKDVLVVEPRRLLDNFQSVFAIYAESNSIEAKSLEEWFKEDWQIFFNLDQVKARALLGEILDDGQSVRKKYLPRHVTTQVAVEQWSSFREEIKYKNRFFFRHELDLSRLKELFDFLETDEAIFNGNLFRARIQFNESLIPPEEMGKPPASQAKNGRANPVGIPYLYAASTPETAIAETRPHPEDLLSVAEFTVSKSLRLLNLQHPRKTISPFAVDENELPKLRRDLAFLCHLGDELSKPILPRVADLEYLPTQYLSEFIKKCDYDGVIFNSSISMGANIALFDDAKIQVVGVYQYRVNNVSYTQQRIHLERPTSTAF